MDILGKKLPEIGLKNATSLGIGTVDIKSLEMRGVDKTSLG